MNRTEEQNKGTEQRKRYFLVGPPGLLLYLRRGIRPLFDLYLILIPLSLGHPWSRLREARGPYPPAPPFVVGEAILSSSRHRPAGSSYSCLAVWVGISSSWSLRLRCVLCVSHLSYSIYTSLYFRYLPLLLLFAVT